MINDMIESDSKIVKFTFCYFQNQFQTSIKTLMFQFSLLHKIY